MKKEQIIIKKLGGRRDNIALVHTEADIPEFLRGTITVEDGKMRLECTEGREVVEFGQFIAWETSEKTGTGFNAWCKSNGFDTIDIVNGEYFERTKPVKAQVIDFDEPVPEFMTGAQIDRGPAGEVVLHAAWGDQTAVPGQCYMYLAYEDGTYALLDLDSESAKQYFVCDEDGNITEQKLGDWLSE
ncbi:MAG: hypothetical protein IKE91_01075 [Clostridia bacterium]|nr:hypothetical protein [Clostridia bacterium]